MYEDILTELYYIAEKQVERKNTVPIKPQYENMIEKSYDFFGKKDGAGGPTQPLVSAALEGPDTNPKLPSLDPTSGRSLNSEEALHIKLYKRKSKRRE